MTGRKLGDTKGEIRGTVCKETFVDKIASEAEQSRATAAVAASAYPVKQNNPLTTVVNVLLRVETSGLEPPTPSLQSNRNLVVGNSSKALTSTPSAACTCACTSEAQNANTFRPQARVAESSLPAANQSDQAAASVNQVEYEGVNQGDLLASLAAVIAQLSSADRQRIAAMLMGHW